MSRICRRPSDRLLHLSLVPLFAVFVALLHDWPTAAAQTSGLGNNEVISNPVEGGDVTSLLHDAHGRRIAEGNGTAIESEIANSAWDTQIFHDYEETRAQQRAQFDTAVQEASFARTAGRQVIMIAVVNHKAARHHLPIFVSSLRAVGSLDRHLIVATIDPEAQALCQKAHSPKLCFEEGLPHSLNGVKVLEEDDRHVDGKFWLNMWMKVIIGLRVNKLGYNLMLVDVDSVFFSNPLDSFDSTAHIVGTNDCDDKYHPKDNRHSETGGINVGLLYFDTSSQATTVLEDWLALGTPHYWEQTAFKVALEAAIDEDDELEFQTLPRRTFASFCCEACGNFLDKIANFRTNWQVSCIAASEWVHFHVACTGENRSYQKNHDEVFEKRYLMQAVWEMVLWHRNQTLLNFDLH